MTEGELALVIVTCVVAAANLITAVAALLNARASKRSADLTRREIALSRKPDLRLEKVTVQHKDGRLIMLGQIHETSGHPAYVYTSRTTIEVVEPVELKTGDVVPAHVASRRGPDVGRRRVYLGRPLRVYGSVKVDHVRPPRDVAIGVVYTYSGDYTRWRRETWNADVKVVVAPTGLIETEVSHSFYHDRYDSQEGVLQGAAKWLQKIRTEMGG